MDVLIIRSVDIPSVLKDSHCRIAKELPLKKFFNTSGLVYKKMQLKDKIPSMSEEEQLKLLATNGMLVKRPMVISEDKVFVGFKEAEWESLL